MTLNEREQFYGEFLEHAVASALQAISDASERTLGRPMPPQARAHVNALLRDGLTELQNMRPMALSPFESLLAGRICAAVREEGDPIEPLQSEALDAVRRLMANFTESLRNFLREVRRGSH